jgi:hypothetical protein
MTSFGADTDAARAASEGAASVMIKPFDPDAFARTVATVGERQRSKRAE